MRVLFVFRNHYKEFDNQIVTNQSISLIKQGIDIDFFPIRNGGIHYIEILFKLRKYLKENNYDLVHAHYGYTALLVGLANPGKTVASLMGSDIYMQHKIIKFIIKLFSKYIWDRTIVKSNKMNDIISNSIIIPNGINLELFTQKGKEESRLKAGFSKKLNIISVAVQPEEKVKNLKLAQEAVQLLGDADLQFHILSKVENKSLPNYYSAADLLLLSSLTEGSPNVIKEAMACNCPIVSTDVGDVREVIGNIEGCYISSFAPIDIAEKIKKALEFSSTKVRTKGRQRIIDLGLDSESIAKKIVDVYKKAISS